MARKIKFAEGEFYHIYNRGVEKRTIFENESDHKRFTLLLYLCNADLPVRFDHLPKWRGLASPELISTVFNQSPRKPLVAIGAYCLMPNHFHLLVKEIETGGISTFMHRLSTAYTMYFNYDRKRTGTLFQGTFKAEHADSDKYLKYLFSYIHLNPLKIIDPKWKERGISNKANAKKYLASNPYSSYMDYMDMKREYSKILNKKEFPYYFPTKKNFEKCLNEWLDYKKLS